MSSYQVLARKWRPHDFESIVGQDHVVRALTRALTEKRLHHAYLFTGTRGVGKTTISRIFAKALNCQGPDGKGDITAHPCGVCPACRAIDEGRFPDYIEMDAASNRSVEDMTALLEKAMYAPTEGRFKVYMIDEVHMLSQTAFNAMLKTLEEPPEYVKFILATTDPQKVPVTVLSRCLQFNLRNMTPQGIVGHMSHILDVEKISYETGALRLLAAGARGSMRDGLSLLDQAIAYCGDKLTEEGVRRMLGMSGSETLTAVLKALAAGNGAEMIRAADTMQNEGLSFAQALRDLAGMLHKMALVQRVPSAVGDDDPDAGVIRELAKAFSPEEVQLCYQIALHGRNDLGLAPDEYAGFTMTLLRMLAFKPAGMRGVASVPARDGASAGAKAAPAAAAPAAAPALAPAAAKPAAPQPAAAAPAPEPKPAQQREAPAPAPSPAPAPRRRRTTIRATTNARPARSLPGESPPPVEDAPEYPDDYDQPEGDSLDWRKIISGAKLTGPVRNIAASSQVLALTDSFARLRVSVGAFATEGNRRLLALFWH
jgi:DNA polymerase-3 subunit gamma/tau